jgi:hypothetical protein
MSAEACAWQARYTIVGCSLGALVHIHLVGAEVLSELNIQAVAANDSKWRDSRGGSDTGVAELLQNTARCSARAGGGWQRLTLACCCAVATNRAGSVHAWSRGTACQQFGGKERLHVGHARRESGRPLAGKPSSAWAQASVGRPGCQVDRRKNENKSKTSLFLFHKHINGLKLGK